MAETRSTSAKKAAAVTLGLEPQPPQTAPKIVVKIDWAAGAIIEVDPPELAPFVDINALGNGITMCPSITSQTGPVPLNLVSVGERAKTIPTELVGGPMAGKHVEVPVGREDIAVCGEGQVVIYKIRAIPEDWSNPPASLVGDYDRTIDLP